MKLKILIGCFLLAFATFSVVLKSRLRNTESPLASLPIGTPIPDFELERMDGQRVSLSELSRDRKVVVLNFWASWCAPCRVEMPAFSKLHADREMDGLLILGINEDEDRAEMEDYLENRPVSFPVLIDTNGEVMERFGIRALPTTVLVGPDGMIFNVQEGIHEYLELLVNTQLQVIATKEKTQ